MKQTCLMMAAAALLAIPSLSKAQESQVENKITVPEFRQALMDAASYIDAHKGTDFRTQFETIPEDMLEKVLPSVSNPRGFQQAAAALKSTLEEPSSGPRLHGLSRPRPSISPSVAAVYPNCPADTIIDTSSAAVCTPAYPDPTNTSWQALVNPLITFGAFSPTDYADVSSQQCSLTVESNLSVVASTLQGIVEVFSAICGAIPSPGGNVCWAVNAVVSAGGAASVGLFGDCSEQDGNVNAAEIDAAFHNTVTIYDALGSVAGTVSTINNNLSTDSTNLTNQISGVSTQITNVDNALSTQITGVDTDLKNIGTSLSTQLTAVDTDVNNRATQIDNEIAAAQAFNLRLAIEANLASATGNAVGLFALPSAEGGYLELTQSIVTDIINKMAAIGQDVSVAKGKLALATNAYKAHFYPGCFLNLKYAYNAAVSNF